MKVSLMGDTSAQNHPGCTLTMSSMFRLIEDVGGDIVSKSTIRYEGDVTQSLDADVLLINGEGSFHGKQKALLDNVCSVAKEARDKGLRVCLVNTVLSGVGEVDFSLFDYVSARDARSYEYGKSLGIKNLDLTPDVCFSSQDIIDGIDGCSGYGMGVIRDGAGYVADPKTCECAKYVEKGQPMFTVMEGADLTGFIAWIKGCGEVVSRRYHGVVFAMMCGIPVTGMSSNTYKMEGLFEMVSDGKHVFDSDYDTRDDVVVPFCSKQLPIDIGKIKKSFDMAING